MKYYEVKFGIVPMNNDARDILAAMAGEVGFETFEETDDGLTGYVQKGLFDENALEAIIKEFPFEGLEISYEVFEAEDKDWNEEWEQEGFEPILIGDDKIAIHDGRHLPKNNPEISIEIDAKMAFGTGTHETTKMMCRSILEFAESDKSSSYSVLDCGTGTGILSICALKLGARKALGYDIDEWSVDNARHNAVINRVDERFTSLLGDASILKNVEEKFDIVMANINRNILLTDMPVFKSKMTERSKLILSGFYTEDIPLLLEKAATLGLNLSSQKSDSNWACIILNQSAL